MGGAAFNFRLNDEIELLRLVTVGSVDDGKSTLIGRLLVDTKGAFEDQLLAVTRKRGPASEAEVDLAMLTDGLQAEREQGITIDVAYRYFATARRKFIMADCPGHEQYTRNMVTGASTATAAIILIDARNGVMPQTRRHAHILALLRVRHLIAAINKMDLVDYDQGRFDAIAAELRDFCRRQGVEDLICIPISALKGDNVARRSEAMAWYEGATLLETLERLPAFDDVAQKPFRFPVQMVNRPQTPEHPDFRGFMGRIVSGSVSVGDPVVSLPSGRRSSVKEIVTFDGSLARAFAPMSVTLTLNDEIDVSRGDMLVRADQPPPRGERTVEIDLCWIGDEPLRPRATYIVKQTTNTLKARVEEIIHVTDIHTLEQKPAEAMEMNDLGRVRLRLQRPTSYDSYRDNRATGSLILIDAFTNNTVGAGMVV
ncbi:MAG: sulfate adenylyltransferase [Zetaproteobacteria bacterium]|nr:MAG: sulfate adenylyltransferase [Zetaproteobacteria bacterium]